MKTMSLTAYAATHDVSRQAAAKWRERGYLVQTGDEIDVAASDEKLRGAGKGRFRVKAHGGKREAGARGAVDRPGLDPSSAMRADQAGGEPWKLWHRIGNPVTIASMLRDAVAAHDYEQLVELAETVTFSEWEAACTAAGWRAWARSAGAAIASDLGIKDGTEVTAALERHVMSRLGELEFTPEDLADPLIEPR